MRIDKHSTTIKDVEQGDVFIYHDYVYIKLGDNVTLGRDEPANCVCLNDGEADYVDPEFEVYLRPDAKVVC